MSKQSQFETLDDMLSELNTISKEGDLSRTSCFLLVCSMMTQKKSVSSLVGRLTSLMTPPVFLDTSSS